MNEDHEVRISGLMTSLITRLEFEVVKQDPSHLPAITQAVTILNGFRSGMLNGNERHILEMNLIKNVTNSVRDFNKGEQNDKDKHP